MPGSSEPLDLVGVQIPYYFRCPISLDLMRDPVTVSTGQTYDRISIESWIATGNTICPVTRAPISDFTPIPNLTLRRLIQDWCVGNRDLCIERITTTKQLDEPATVSSLLNQASSVSNPVSTRVSALVRLKEMIRDSEKKRSVICFPDKAREMLINIVFSDSSSRSTELNQEALAILVMFQLCESDCTEIASDLNKVIYLSKLLFHSSIEVRINSASLIETVLNGTISSDLRAEFSNVDGIVSGVIDILKNLSSYPRAWRIGVRALFALCLVKQSRHKAVQAGAAEALIERLADLEKCDAERALATIELLCRIPSGSSAFAAHSLTVPLLAKMILKISDMATEYAAAALMALCSESERSRKEAVTAGVLTQLLLLVQSDCTARAKRKAQMLLKMLHDSWREDSTGNSDDFTCSEVMRACFEVHGRIMACKQG